ncbi:MAG: hypothetical protein QM687_09990 [Ferruginibacter sp.]
MKKLLLLIVPAFIALAMFYTLSAFKPAEQSIKVTCQFLPGTSDFADVELENCNNLASNSSVAAGSGWTASLLAAGCTTVYITTNLPAVHPAGTISIYKNGVLAGSHTVAQNQPASFFDLFPATSNDKFVVTW